MVNQKTALIAVIVVLLAIAGGLVLLFTTAPRAPQSLATLSTTPAVPVQTAPQATPSTAQRVVEIVDLAGRHVKVRVPVQRVVLVDGAHVGYIIAIDAVGGKDALKKIVGLDLDAWKRYRMWIYEKYIKACPWLAHVADVGTSRDLNIEKIIELKPDVVIAPLYAKDRLADAVKKLEGAGIPVVFIDYHAETWENHKRSTEILGILFGREDRAREVLEWYKKRLDLILSRLKKVTKKPKVYFEGGFRKYWTYGDYMWGALVKLAGGINIAEGKVERWGEINPEYVLAQNPDVIVISGSYWVKRPNTIWLGYYSNMSLVQERLSKWIDRPGWENLKAIRHGRVYVIHHGLARTIWDIVAIEFLAKAFYPALFKDVDPVKDFKEFHEKFLSISYSGIWMAKWEQPRKRVTIVDAMGRKVEVLVPVKKVALLYGLEDWVAVGGEDALSRIAVMNSWRYKQYRPDWWRAWTEHYPWLEDIPDTGQPGRNFKVEVIIKAKPDVVIATPWMYKQMEEAGDLKRLQEAGIPVVVIDFVPKTTDVNEHLEAVKRSVMVLGELLGYQDRAEELAKFYENELLKIVEKAKEAKVKPKVIVFATWSTWRAYGEKGMYHVWVTFAGGEDIGAKAIKGSSGDINPEFVLKENPDVIVFTCNNNFPEGQRVVIGYTVTSPKPAKEALAQLIKRPGWESLNAVKNKRVYLIHHGLSHGHVFQYVCLEFLAKWLHPELFKDLDPAKSLAEFYEKFMPYPLKGVWGVGIADP